MKLIFTILFFPLVVNATNYYVKNAGSDAANGLTNGTAWKTLAKAVTVLAKHDSVFLNRGDVWIEKFYPPVDSIYVGAYGTGSKPLITGLQTASLSSIGGGLYQATLSDATPKLHVVLVGGVIHGKGRYPDNSFLTYSTAQSTQRSVATTLPASPDYSGGEVVERNQCWVTDTRDIDSQKVVGGFTIIYTRFPDFTYVPNGTLYFIQNLPSLCNLHGDWALDSATKTFTVHLDSIVPVQYSILDTIVRIHGKTHISFDNIDITGADASAFYVDTSRDVTLSNCKVNYTGGANNNLYYRNGLSGAGICVEKCPHFIADNDTVLNSLNNGIFVIHSSDTSTISNCYVKNSGMIDGLGASGNGAGCGMYTQNNNMTITTNNIYNSGYVGIYWGNRLNYLYRNHIDSFGLRKDDGGGIYDYEPRGGGSIVKDNIITNGIGTGCNAVPCIYLDANTDSTTFQGNTAFNGRWWTVQFNYPHDMHFLDNTIVGGTNISGGSIGILQPIGGSTYRDTLYRNTVYTPDSNYAAIKWYYGQLGTLSISDSNTIIRYAKDSTAFFYTSSFTSYSLSGWHGLTGYEANTHQSPSGIIASIPGVLHYNATLVNKTDVFWVPKMDAKGVVSVGSITMRPFTDSKILFDIPKTGGQRLGGGIHF